MKVFVFLSARCPCSASHEALLADLAREFSGTPFYAVHSNVDEMAEVAREHFQKAPFQFPIFQDEGAKIADEFGALKTPHAFVVSGEGKILFSGGVTNSTRGPAATRQLLKEALVKLGEGKNPDPAEFRTLGCLIARP